MQIHGLQKLTLLDYPGKTACTVFTGGCNFRCPFCHNASLVLRPETQPQIPEAALFAFLEKRRGVLEGVAVTGGEPTLQPDLPAFLKRIRALGYAVKLDTNGARPDVLRRLLDDGLLDLVAMDIKSSPEGYARACGLDVPPLDAVRDSAALLLEGRIPYEFRTTLVRELHGETELRGIGHWLRGAERFYLQSYRDSGDVIAPGLSAHSPSELQSLLCVLREDIPNAALRGAG